MAGDGTITRKDIMTDDALTVGNEYAKIMETAIAANKNFAAGLKEINGLAASFRKSSGQDEYITLKNQQALANQKVIDSTKQLEAAEVSAQKILQAKLKTDKDALALSDKEANSKKRNTKLTVEERIQNEIANRVLKQEALERLGLVGAYAKLNAARTQAKRTLLDLLAAENQDVKAIKEATKAFEALDKRVRSADKAVGDFTKNVGNYPKLKGFASNLRDLAGAFGLVGGIQAFAGIMANAYQTIKQFEQSLADLSSITGATGKDLAFLRSNAIELGKGVEGGAIAVVEAYKLIAGAKPELLDNVQALNQVTDAAITLSQAAGIDLPEAATALTDAMNQFGAPADQAQRFIDALANGAKFGSAEIPQLTESLLKFGAVARTSNVSVEESVALVELLAENGLKSAEAGTALRNVLLKLSATDALPKTAVAELDRLGISMKVLKDTSLTAEERLKTLAPLLKDNSSIVKVFGIENATAAINVLSNTERLKELTSQVHEVGTATEQASVRMDTLNGKTEILKSTYDSFVLSIGNGSGAISQFFSFFIDGLKDTLELLIRANTSWDELNAKAKQTGASEGGKQFQTRLNFAMSFGSTDEEGTIESIRKAAFNQRKVLYEEYIKNQKAIKDFNPYAINLSGVSGKDLQRRKEQLNKQIALEEAVANEANKRLEAIRNPKKNAVKNEASVSVAKTDDKAEKERLKKLKALNDAEYELEKSRLERIIKVNQEIADDQELTDDLRIASSENVNEKEFELIELTKKHKLDYDKFVLDSDKLNANQKKLIQEDAFNAMIDSNEKAQEKIRKIRAFDEESYAKSLKKQISENEIKLNSELQAENERFKALGNVEELANKEREKKIEEHERNIFEIKKKYSIDALKIQISNLESELAASDLLPEGKRLTSAKRLEIAEKLSKAKLDLSDVESSNNKKKNQLDVVSEKEKAEQILNISSDLTNALNQLSNSLFETKVQNIQVEIDKNNEYYDKQIEAAGDNEKQKDLLEKERDKKNKILEDKKKKEQHKQDVANKASAIANAVIATALAVIQAYAQLGPIGGTVGAILVGAVGAASIAAIAAAPLPKYKTGRKGGKDEYAIVGDGGVPEIIERRNGKVELTPARDTLVHLASGDNVYKDIEDYKRNGRMSVMNSLDLEHKKVNEYFNITLDRDKYGKEIVTELKEVVKSVKRIKLKTSQQKPMDLNHELWKIKNIKS